MAKKSRDDSSFIGRHSLTIVVLIVLLSWTLLYSVSDQSTHWGSFFGNAVADWSGVLVVVLATKRMYEKGSAESHEPPHPILRPVPKILRDHSLTIFLVITGAGWVALFAHLRPEAKWGEVVGNIVSEWTQIIGLVLLTKKLREVHSKESKR